MVSHRLEGRPVRWAPRERLVGDYDGRERTLQVFNADAADQRRLLEEIHRIASDVVVIFHSVRQSQERYADFLEQFARERDSGELAREREEG